jgi:GDP-L-fucose synthase
MINRFHKAKVNNEPVVTVWGSGKPQREFLHVDDLAEGIFTVLRDYSETEPINLGSGKEYYIGELAELIKDITGYQGEIVFDSTKPDGTPRKILDSSRIKSLGWKPNYELKEGLKNTYLWAIENKIF